MKERILKSKISWYAGKGGIPNWKLLFLAGFLSGIILMLFQGRVFLEEPLFFGKALLERVYYSDLDYQKLFIYILQKRLGTMLILVIAATTGVGIVVMYGYALWFGMSMGVLMSVVTIRFGGKGIFYFLAAVFPQECLYIPAYILLLNMLCELCNKLYFPHKVRILNYGNRRRPAVKKVVAVCAILGVTIIGVMIECYVNPQILKKILIFF